MARSYINVTGNISHIVAFRITPDITRENRRPGTGSLNGSLVFRLKYAFAQFNLDDWMTQGIVGRASASSRRRCVDFDGRHLPLPLPGHDVRRARRLPATRRTPARRSTTTSPSNYGDVHVGVYNGEGYSQARGERSEGVPDPRHPPAVRRRASRCCAACGSPASTTRQLRQERRADARRSFEVTFEHKYLNAGFDYLDAHRPDSTPQPPRSKAQRLVVLGDAEADERASEGAAPLRPPARRTTASTTAARHRTIVGVAYWFPHQGNVSTRAAARLRRRRRSTTSRRRSRRRRRSPCTGWSTSRDSRRRIMMMSARKLLAVAGGACVALGAGVVAAADGADQRRGRDVPVPDLLEVVRRVQQAAPERADQLPVDRLGRRHPADHQPDGVLRRHRRPDDQRPAAGGARQDPALPDRARRRRAGLQHPGRDRAS